MSDEKSIVWRRLDIAGHEFVRVFSDGAKNILEGAAILVFEKKFCKIDYKIICDKGWETLSAKISGFVGDQKVEIEISVDEKKHWILNGETISAVTGCIDIDLNFSPLTNTLPIRRLNFSIGEKKKVRAAWLRFPSFKLEPLEQIYERTAQNTFHYESAGGRFTTDIEVDDAGFVLNYPNLWKIEGNL